MGYFVPPESDFHTFFGKKKLIWALGVVKSSKITPQNTIN